MPNLVKVVSAKHLDVIVKTRKNKAQKQTVPKLPKISKVTLQEKLDGNTKNNEPYKKKHIPQALRIALWEKYNKKQYDVKCQVAWCNCRITPFTFEAGHNIPEKYGGETTLENLIPICANCNRSMGCKYTIDEFSSLFMPKKELKCSHNQVYPIETQLAPINPRFLPQMEDSEQNDHQKTSQSTTENLQHTVMETISEVGVHSEITQKTENTQLKPKKRWWQSLFNLFSH